jgi:acyl carrier protein
MRLDTVELVMAVEDYFEVTIPNEVAETLVTVRKLHEFVVLELTRTGRFGGDSSRVYEQVKEIVVRQLGVRPEEVVPTARFVEDLRADWSEQV